MLRESAGERELPEIMVSSSRANHNDPIHEDIEHLIQIAAQLFHAIEREIHHVEQELHRHPAAHSSEKSDRIIFKEKLIRTAANLNISLRETADLLSDHAEGASRRSPDETHY